jgi:hypothetical protein
MDPSRFTRIDATAWRIEPRGEMRVPAIIYADEDLIRDMDDKVYEQAANVATLPGIVQAAYAMPNRRGCGIRSRTGRRGVGWRGRLRYFVWRSHDADRYQS